MQASGDVNRLGHLRDVFQRHTDEEEDEERRAFEHSDELESCERRADHCLVIPRSEAPRRPFFPAKMPRFDGARENITKALDIYAVCSIVLKAVRMPHNPRFTAN